LEIIIISVRKNTKAKELNTTCAYWQC